MASLTEHVMINKLGDDLDSAITFAGGDTSNVSHIMQYPKIIREQLSSKGIEFDKGIILEGDSCVIIADSEGRDQYNTEYAVGEKSGLNPGSYYVRICTAVKDIEPIYIDLTPALESIQPEEVNIKEIIEKIETLETKVEVLEKSEEEDLDYIVNQVVNSDLLKETFVVKAEVDELVMDEKLLDDLLTF